MRDWIVGRQRRFRVGAGRMSDRRIGGDAVGGHGRSEASTKREQRATGAMHSVLMRTEYRIGCNSWGVRLRADEEHRVKRNGQHGVQAAQMSVVGGRQYELADEKGGSASGMRGCSMGIERPKQEGNVARWAIPPPNATSCHTLD